MRRNLILIVLISVVGLYSCKQEHVDLFNEEVLATKSAQIVLDEITVENAVEEVNYESAFYSIAEISLWNLFKGGSKWGWKNSLRYKIGQCPNVTINKEEGGYPKTITLDYGDSTVLRNGKVMSGSVVIYISSPPNTNGYKKEVTYNNFSIDSINVDGTSTMMFVGDNVIESKHTLTSNLIIILTDGTVLHREEEKVREWLTGLDTNLDQSDDTIQVTGFIQVEVGDTLNYKKEITDPLIKSGECRHFISGVVDFSENGIVFASVDYGNGECDNSALLSKDGETIDIDLAGKEPKMNNGNHYGNRNGNNGEGNNGNSNGNGNGKANGKGGNG